MIDHQSIIAVIPARGGSKGVPRKNIRDIAGKPLIAWTIEEAKKSKYIDRLVLSSEDKEIINVATNWGCEVPFVRPDELARDDISGIEPILHALSLLPDYDFVILLQPTSPLRSVLDIDGCIENCIKQRANASVSVSESEKSPYWMYEIDDNLYLKPVIKIENPIVRRQELPPVYALNGAVYMARCEWFLKKKSFLTEETMAFLMPRERSLDIDTEFDLRLCECILKMRLNCK